MTPPEKLSDEELLDDLAKLESRAYAGLSRIHSERRRDLDDEAKRRGRGRFSGITGERSPRPPGSGFSRSGRRRETFFVRNSL